MKTVEEFEPTPDPLLKPLVLCPECGHIARRWLVCPANTFEFRSDCSPKEHGHYRCKCGSEFTVEAR